MIKTQDYINSVKKVVENLSLLHKQETSMTSQQSGNNFMSRYQRQKTKNQKSNLSPKKVSDEWSEPRKAMFFSHTRPGGKSARSELRVSDDSLRRKDTLISDQILAQFKRKKSIQRFFKKNTSR
jgi:hypothetical protein